MNLYVEVNVDQFLHQPQCECPWYAMSGEIFHVHLPLSNSPSSSQTFERSATKKRSVDTVRNKLFRHFLAAATTAATATGVSTAAAEATAAKNSFYR